MAREEFTVPLEAAGCQHDTTASEETRTLAIPFGFYTLDQPGCLVHDEVDNTAAGLELAVVVETASEQSDHQRITLPSTIRDEPIQEPRRKAQNRADRIAVGIVTDHLTVGEEVRQRRAADLAGIAADEPAA